MKENKPFSPFSFSGEFDTSSPLIKEEEEETTIPERTIDSIEQRVYMAHDIQKSLGLGKSKTYEFLEEVYRNKSPFRVIKVGKLFRIPKKSFDAWLDAAN